MSKVMVWKQNFQTFGVEHKQNIAHNTGYYTFLLHTMYNITLSLHSLPHTIERKFAENHSLLYNFYIDIATRYVPLLPHHRQH